MYGSSITDETSEAYRLLNTLEARDGLYYSEEYIAVALGSYYGPVGSKYRLTLSSGDTMHVIKVDSKSDEHTVNGCEHKSDGSMLELILTDDASAYYPGPVNSGDFNDVFKGSVVKIERSTE